MSWISAIPVIGKILGKTLEKVWPDRQAERLKTLEIELEQARQSQGRITPRMALEYLLVVAFALSLLLGTVKFFYPGFGTVPDWLDKLLPAAGALFAL